ncbi:5-amino-6-(D-ribitylamino)uracil--L-tyrosine 4-hydroxyphenyl transferase CofH [Paraburkholderia rhynchosiae]|uniref:FO synthase n=1 Tax=Paraburkholderia rhynchosiae TaxID=487049 RepID=A0A2N7W504_9BURK|nr:5-amino-6-(D-ribitylamino)uracil--L-tyrosine 4-hydroxyphenyl transferase CofH [Paraburkholderia rhynchosiae]PMS24485.1 7,8-didemethyl-8-hydroxy-5-deazariboflavin synthase [Paraburkholderia rhynchosiae]CAB3736178.1 FO synthase [Paraburkholderia rhynchosiae]
MTDIRAVIHAASSGRPPSAAEALMLAVCNDMPLLLAAATEIRDRGARNVVTYSRKIFLPVTRLCRDVCHYCTFSRQSPSVHTAYLTLTEMLETARTGARMGCKEALITLGEKPELRYPAAREALDKLGFETTIDYVVHVAEAVFKETGLLPHVNAGCLSDEEVSKLRRVSPSMGIMLESAAERLCQPGMPHFGSPDKLPAARLATLEAAGRQNVPMTSGILVGIGETRRERVEALLALREIHGRYENLQEVIVQNFRAKPGTLMANAAEPSLDELTWTIAVARIIFGPDMGIQAPPNLSPGALGALLESGISDWGGVSPLTRDFVNPEAPWPHLDELTRETRANGKHLQERLTIYPRYALGNARWVDDGLRTTVLRTIDSEGFARIDPWVAGGQLPPPTADLALLRQADRALVTPELDRIVRRASDGELLDEQDVVRLFQARGEDFAHVCHAADQLRRAHCGDTVTYVVTRNINYTNICYFGCQFCAFSKGQRAHRGATYDLDQDEIGTRVREAWQRGATEVCLQGGIHPSYTGESYLSILKTVKTAAPDIHVHAFSPLEIWHGAQTLGLPLNEYLLRLKNAGLATLPGTAAEILDDEVRATLCPDKLKTDRWLEVMHAAHGLGVKSTATIMFGHIERLEHWARHLLRLRNLAACTAGITEFVPLAFVHMEAPIYRKGRSRKGPTFREALLMHAVSRLVLHPHVKNIQASWVKMGPLGAQAALNAGVNDMGGTLMDESITRSAGAVHGQEMTPAALSALIRSAGRVPRQRTTVYGTVPEERVAIGAAHVGRSDSTTIRVIQVSTRG